MAHKPGHFGPTEWADIDMSNYPSTYPAASVGTNPTNYNFGNINPDTQMQFSGRKAGWLNNMNTNTDSYRNMYGGGSSGILGKYTPDFIGEDFIIETKGRANESFPIRWKLFKKLVTEQFPQYTLYKPQNQKECDRTIEIILSKLKK